MSASASPQRRSSLPGRHSPPSSEQRSESLGQQRQVVGAACGRHVLVEQLVVGSLDELLECLRSRRGRRSEARGARSRPSPGTTPRERTTVARRTRSRRSRTPPRSTTARRRRRGVDVGDRAALRHAVARRPCARRRAAGRAQGRTRPRRRRRASRPRPAARRAAAPRRRSSEGSPGPGARRASRDGPHADRLAHRVAVAGRRVEVEVVRDDGRVDAAVASSSAEQLVDRDVAPRGVVGHLGDVRENCVRCHGRSWWCSTAGRPSSSAATSVGGRGVERQRADVLDDDAVRVAERGLRASSRSGGVAGISSRALDDDVGSTLAGDGASRRGRARAAPSAHFAASIETPSAMPRRIRDDDDPRHRRNAMRSPGDGPTHGLYTPRDPSGRIVMAKRALITGITGQDGSYLAELLLEKDYEVRRRRPAVLDREPRAHQPPAGPRSRSSPGDLQDETSLVARDARVPRRTRSTTSPPRASCTRRGRCRCSPGRPPRSA